MLEPKSDTPAPRTSGAGQPPGPPRRRGMRSVSAQVADAIQEMILMGTLRPEQPLTQDQIAEMLGVSTMPVREALLQLSHDGLVTTAKRRSFQVAPATRADLRDIYWLHATLAGELTARTCESDHLEVTVATLKSVHERWVEMVDSGSAEALEDLNFEFHRAINVAANAPKLLVFMRNTLRLIPMHFYSLLPAWKAVSTSGHAEILAALAEGNPDKARKAAEAHVIKAAETLIGYFDDNGYWTLPRSGV
jgi:DNA-binding GntR family transcriptional regulator